MPDRAATGLVPDDAAIASQSHQSHQSARQAFAAAKRSHRNLINRIFGGPHGVSVGTHERRLRTGRLKVCGYRCPNLLNEAKLYRYPTPQERVVIGERPIDENNASVHQAEPPSGGFPRQRCRPAVDGG